MRNFLAVSAGMVLLCVLPPATSAQKTTVPINTHSIVLDCDDVSSDLCTDTYLHKNYGATRGASGRRVGKTRIQQTDCTD